MAPQLKRDSLGGGADNVRAFETAVTLPWRYRFLIPYAILVLALAAWVILHARRGPPPNEWEYALTVYVAVPFGLPWSLLFAGLWIYSGLLINGALLFGLGWLIEGNLARPA